MSTNITNEMRNILSEVLGRELTDEEFGDGENLVQKLNIDSLSGLQIIIKMEQVFNIIIEDDDFAIKLIDSIKATEKFINEFN